MTEQELADKRITFSFEFSRYLMAHPDIAERLPQDATIVFAVDDDPTFTRYEQQLARQVSAEGQPVVTVHVRGLAPPVESRLIEPQVELA